MGEGSGSRVYEAEFVWQDAGYQIQFKVSDWLEMVEKDFTSFEAIKEIYRTELDELEEHLREHAIENEGEKPQVESPSIVISNIPKEWKEDFAEAAPVYSALQMMLCRMGLYSLIEQEVEAQDELLEEGQYKPLLVRQSAFFEEYLTLLSQIAFQDEKGGTLSNKDMKLIQNMGHTDRIRLAYLFGEIDETEHGLLQEMANWRNEIAHMPWIDFDSQDESQIESTAERVRDLLETRIEEAEKEYEDVEETTLEKQDDFDLGFQGLDTDLQLLQIEILVAVDQIGGSVPISKIQELSDRDPDRVRQRTLRMSEIGYLEYEDGEVRMTDHGKEFLENEV